MTDAIQPRPYFRTPTISPDGQRLAFVHAGDIWLVDTCGGDAVRLTAHPRSSRAPRWSPDGERLAFTSARSGGGDIYIMPLQGGAVERVTSHDTASTVECWSVDGAHLFFSAAREHLGVAIYRVAAGGGTPITWLSQPYEHLGGVALAPGGGTLAFHLSRDPWWRRGPNRYGGAEIWLVSSHFGANDFRRLSDEPGLNRWPMWNADGTEVYFVSDRDGCENIWSQPLEGWPPRPITAFREGRLLWPSISADGRTIVFERDFGIWRLDTASGAAAPIPIRARSDTKLPPGQVLTYRGGLQELALAPDGKKLAFVVHGEVFADFADKETDKERRQGPSFRVTNTPARESDIAWSPDSRRLTYVSDRHGDEEVYLHDFVTHQETRLTDQRRDGGGPRGQPCFSPDGAWIACTRGDDEIRLIDTRTGEERPFVHADISLGTSLAWSPDSRWLMFVAQDERLFSNLYVQRIDGDRPQQVTWLSNLWAGGVLWAPRGDFIIFSTSQYRDETQIARVDLRPPPPFFREVEFEKLFRGPEDRIQKPEAGSQEPVAEEQDRESRGRRTDAGEPQAEEEAPQDDSEPTPEAGSAEAKPPASGGARAPVEIDFDGIERRLRFLTPAEMDAYAHCISPDSRDLIFSATVAGKTNLWTLPLDEPRAEHSPRQLTNSTGAKRAAHFAPDGKSIYYLDGGQVYVRKFPNGESEQIQVGAEVLVDFDQEKLQIFDECWRLLRDRFFDPTFRGLDWSAAREQFAPLAAGAQTTSDLHDIINLMVGELRSSHLGIGYSWQNWSQDGYLGLLFDPQEQATTGRLRIAAVVPDGPAARAGDGTPIRPGEYLLAVDGTPLTPGASLDRLLQRTAGRRVRLRVGPADGEGAREVAVRPVDADQYDELRYRAWALANEAYVHRASNGRLGYVHIRAMDYDCYQRFLADLDAETYSKEGVVVDVRFNRGGHTATFILDVLARRSTLLSAFRGRPPADAAHLSGNRVLNKPTVLVVNEACASNTEMLIEGYRRLGLGRVVGRPTAGAVIWTWRHRLLDDSIFSVPRFRVATPEGEDLESVGRAVDVDVPLPLGAAAQGRDPQLDAAVATLLAQIDEARARPEA